MGGQLEKITLRTGQNELKRVEGREILFILNLHSLRIRTTLQFADGPEEQLYSIITTSRGQLCLLYLDYTSIQHNIM